MESLLSLGYPFFWENKRSQPIGNSRKCLELVWILGLRCLFARSTGSLCSTLLNVKSLGSISSIRSWTLKGNALFFISAANDMTTSKQGNPFLSTMDDITTASTKSKSVKPPSSKWRPTKAICIMVGIVLLAAVMVMMIIGFTVFEAKDLVITVGSISPKNSIITVSPILPKDPIIIVGFISLKGWWCALWSIHS